MKKSTAGLGKKEREQLTLLLNANLVSITPKNAAQIINSTLPKATLLLSVLTKKGWLSRVKHGVYIPVPVQIKNSEIMVDEPWLFAKSLFDPCYIGGWSAAEHWGFTEQIFNTTMVFTLKKIPAKEFRLNGISLVVKRIKKWRMFGISDVWKNDKKVSISDPTKTVIDAFNDPAVVGGIRMAIDILSNYLNSTHNNLKLLIDYGSQMKNTAIFKRVGFCLEYSKLGNKELLETIRSAIKKGYSQLDPDSPGECLITSWGLWVPKAWKRGNFK